MTTKKRKTWRNMLTIRKLFIDSGNTFESHGVTERLTFLLFGTEHVQAVFFLLIRWKISYSRGSNNNLSSSSSSSSFSFFCCRLAVQILTFGSKTSIACFEKIPSLQIEAKHQPGFSFLLFRQRIRMNKYFSILKRWRRKWNVDFNFLPDFIITESSCCLFLSLSRNSLSECSFE